MTDYFIPKLHVYRCLLLYSHSTRQKEKLEEQPLEIFGVLKRKKLPFAKPTPIPGVQSIPGLLLRHLVTCCNFPARAETYSTQGYVCTKTIDYLRGFPKITQ